MSRPKITTQRGYDFGEVASALQKAIRRNLEEDALYWATELDKSGYGNYVFKRLRIIVSEDIGPGEPGLAAEVRALYDNWVEHRKLKDPMGAERIFLVHAVIACCRARKSRIVDTALTWFYSDQVPHQEIEDYALDVHTARGKRMKRGNKHFYEVAAQVSPEADIEDPYLVRAMQVDGALLSQHETLFDVEPYT